MAHPPMRAAADTMINQLIWRCISPLMNMPSYQDATSFQREPSYFHKICTSVGANLGAGAIFGAGLMVVLSSIAVTITAGAMHVARWWEVVITVLATLCFGGAMPLLPITF